MPTTPHFESRRLALSATVLAAALVGTLTGCGNAGVPVANAPTSNGVNQSVTDPSATIASGTVSSTRNTSTGKSADASPSTTGRSVDASPSTTPSNSEETPNLDPSGGPSFEPPDTLSVDGRTILGVPPGWSFPPNSQIKTLASDETGGMVELRGPGGKELLNHFRQMLPRAGYDISVDMADTLTFSGRGWAGAITGFEDEPGGLVTFGVQEDEDDL